MTTMTRALPRRETLHGVRQIVRFNWPFYAIAIPSAWVAPWAIEALGVPAALRLSLFAGLALIWFWIFASLAVSWLVYDRSPLMTGSWILPALDGVPRAWVAIHAGLDEMTPVIERALGRRGRSFDIFDPLEMTEPSISRARTSQGGLQSNLGPNPSRPLSDSHEAPEHVDFRHLPVADASIDAAFVMLSAHELRTHDTRVALFSDIGRGLTPGGQVIVAEHLRDVPNFVAYGPGALHFHSRRAWLQTFTSAGLTVTHERSVTPFVHVFVLRRSS